MFTKNEPRGIPSRLIFQSEYLLSSWIFKEWWQDFFCIIISSCDFWHEHKIYKFINDTLFEQFSGTYTRQSDYLLPNLTLLAKAETGYIWVWGQRRLNYLKHHHKVLYYNLLTSCSLPANSIPSLSIPRNKPNNFFSAGKTIHRKRSCHRTAKSNRYDAWGAEDE